MREDRLVTAEITGGILLPTTYSLLPAALDSLWSALQFRPIGRPQWQWFERYLTGPSADRFVAEYLDRTGPLDLPVVLPEAVHHLRLHWTTPEADR
ncbi:hypothetical protein RMN57_11190 [Kitasatospora sp. CM 4170]|uniref:Uncharacterized protein n=1 Tax=Kitasatospora aburaviensis TaxID=67265 RepID=A0ABW1EQK8_9ACTN|nr:hypothetical protein [Kitasatospora sp. CM 4170]WNM45239.1 hypothetical protein RMN57_11190 [Kitasatospora sp. CM 4170]